MFSIFVAFGEKNMARDLLNARPQGRESYNGIGNSMHGPHLLALEASKLIPVASPTLSL